MQPPQSHLDDFDDFCARRAAARAEIAARSGVDEAMIARLVRAFYERAARDPLLGPIFAAKISDWEPHLQQMMRFWSSVALLTGVYKGRPMPKHVDLPIDARHFARWLEIFSQTAQDICGARAAAHFIERAEKIAASLAEGRARFGERK